MNKTLEIDNIYKFVKSHNITNKELSKVTGLTTNLDVNSDEDLVFYKLHDNKDALEIFKNRLKKSEIGIIAVTGYIKELENHKYIVVENSSFLEFQKYCADIIYPYNENNLKLVAVTGTNGKTSVVNICTQILNQRSITSFSIGTIGVMDSNGNILKNTSLTTPSYIELREILYSLSSKYDVCFMELSSHALVQGRLNELRLDACAWTSFSRDHLDFHKSMDEYFDAKSLIISKYLKNDGQVVIPNEQKELIAKVKNISDKIIETRPIIQTLPLEFKVHYNKQNLEVAIDLCKLLYPSSQSEVLNFEKLKLPKGRFSIIEHKNTLVVIDYSHTPDALSNICDAIKKTFSDYRLSVVFGCGGDRDPGKRALMSKAILPYADNIIITSDNPRFEDPEKIIDDIVKGIPKNINFIQILDRETAIINTLKSCNDKEVILIAGKGHEEYQDIKGVKYPFSDFSIVNQFIRENR